MDDDPSPREEDPRSREDDYLIHYRWPLLRGRGSASSRFLEIALNPSVPSDIPTTIQSSPALGFDS